MRGSSRREGGSQEGWGLEQEASALPVSRKHGKHPCGLSEGQVGVWPRAPGREWVAFPPLPPAGSSGKSLQRGPTLPQFESHLNLNPFCPPTPLHSPSLRSPWVPGCGPGSLAGFLLCWVVLFLRLEFSLHHRSTNTSHAKLLFLTPRRPRKLSSPTCEVGIWNQACLPWRGVGRMRTALGGHRCTAPSAPALGESPGL